MGAQGVGKTAIANRLVYNYFTEQYLPTSGEKRYQVDALLDVCEEDGVVLKTKEKLILKKSFKHSALGRNLPTAQRREETMNKRATLRRVVSTNVDCMVDEQKSNEFNPHPVLSKQQSAGTAFTEGASRGLKRLKFTLVDMASDISEMQPTTYKSVLHNAAGFFLVCSFDNAESLSSIETMLQDIRNTNDTPVVIIVNKCDICEDDRVLGEQVVAELAEQMNVEYCCASMSSKDGYEEMANLLLNVINVSAEIEEEEDAIPEDFAYFEELDE